MRLGVAYNVFDGHELLEASARSVRASASHIVVVWQARSNFGHPCHPHLRAYLDALVSSGLGAQQRRFFCFASRSWLTRHSGHAARVRATRLQHGGAAGHGVDARRRLALFASAA